MILPLSDNTIVRYIVIYQNLDFCYDQMVHPQKRCFPVSIFSKRNDHIWRAHPKEAIFFLLLNHLEGRLLLRKLLDSTIGRIIELKHELVNLDFIEYSFIDDVLAEMKVGHR